MGRKEVISLELVKIEGVSLEWVGREGPDGIGRRWGLSEDGRMSGRIALERVGREGDVSGGGRKGRGASVEWIAGWRGWGRSPEWVKGGRSLKWIPSKLGRGRGMERVVSTRKAPGQSLTWGSER